MREPGRTVPFHPLGVSGRERGLGRGEGAYGARPDSNTASLDSSLAQRERPQEGYASDFLPSSSPTAGTAGRSQAAGASPLHPGQHPLYSPSVPGGSFQQSTTPGRTSEGDCSHGVRTGGSSQHNVTQNYSFSSRPVAACTQQSLPAVSVGPRPPFLHPPHHSAPYSYPPHEQPGVVGGHDFSAGRHAVSFQSSPACLRTGGQQEEHRMPRGSETPTPPPAAADFQSQQHAQPQGQSGPFRQLPDAGKVHHLNTPVTSSRSGTHQEHTHLAVQGHNQVVPMSPSADQGNCSSVQSASPSSCPDILRASEKHVSKLPQQDADSSHRSGIPVVPQPGSAAPQSPFPSRLSPHQSPEGCGHFSVTPAGQGDGERSLLQNGRPWGDAPSTTSLTLQSDGGAPQQARALSQQYRTEWGIPAQRVAFTTSVGGSACAPSSFSPGSIHQGGGLASDSSYAFGGGGNSEATRFSSSSPSVQTSAGMSDIPPSAPPGGPRACFAGSTSQKQSQFLSPVPGVVYDRGGEKWIARWSENGRPFKKTFAVGKHGFDAAKRMAEESRLQALHAKQRQCSLREQTPPLGGGPGDGKSRSGLISRGAEDRGGTPTAPTDGSWGEGRKDTQGGKDGAMLSRDIQRVTDGRSQEILSGNGKSEESRRNSSLPARSSPCVDTWSGNEAACSSGETVPGTHSGDSQVAHKGGTELVNSVEQNTLRAASSLNNLPNSVARDKLSSSRAKANAAANARRRKKREEERAARQAEKLALSQSQSNTLSEVGTSQASRSHDFVNASGANRNGEVYGSDSKSCVYSSERSSFCSDYPIFSRPSQCSSSSSPQVISASPVPFAPPGGCVSSSPHGSFRSEEAERCFGIPRPVNVRNGSALECAVGLEGITEESQFCASALATPAATPSDFMALKTCLASESGEVLQGQQNQMPEERGEGDACLSATVRGPVAAGVKRQQQQLARQVQKQQYLLRQQEQLLHEQESLLATLMRRRWQRVTRRWRIPTAEVLTGRREVLPAHRRGDRVGRSSAGSAFQVAEARAQGPHVAGKAGSCVRVFREETWGKKESGISSADGCSEEVTEDSGQMVSRTSSNTGEEVTSRKRRRTRSQCWPIPAQEELKAAEAFTLLGLQRRAAAMEGNLLRATVLAGRKVRAYKARRLEHKSEENTWRYESGIQEEDTSGKGRRNGGITTGRSTSGSDEETGLTTTGPEAGIGGERVLEKDRKRVLEKEDEKRVHLEVDSILEREYPASEEGALGRHLAERESRKPDEAEKLVHRAKDEESCRSSHGGESAHTGPREEEETTCSASQERDARRKAVARSCEEDSAAVQLEKSSSVSDTSTRLDSSRLSSPQENRERRDGTFSSALSSSSPLTSSSSPPSVGSPPALPAPLLFPCTAVQIEDLCLSTLLTLGRVRPQWRRRGQREPFGWHITQIKPSLVLPPEPEPHPPVPSQNITLAGGPIPLEGLHPSTIENSRRGNTLTYSDIVPCSQDGKLSSLCFPSGSRISRKEQAQHRCAVLDVYIHTLRPLFSALGPRLEYLHLSSTDIASVIQGLDLCGQGDVIDSVLASLDRLYHRNQISFEPAYNRRSGRGLQEENDFSYFADQSPLALPAATTTALDNSCGGSTSDKRNGGGGEKITGGSHSCTSWHDVVETPPCTSPSSPSHRPCPFSSVTDVAGASSFSSDGLCESSPATQERGRTSDAPPAPAAFSRSLALPPVPCTRSSSQATVASSGWPLPQQSAAKSFSSSAGPDTCNTMVLAYNPEAKVLRQLNYLAVGTRVYVQISVLEEALNRRSGVEAAAKNSTTPNKSSEKSDLGPCRSPGEDAELKNEAKAQTNIKTEKGKDTSASLSTQSPEKEEVASANEVATAGARVGSQYVVAELLGRKFQLPSGESLVFRLLSLPTCHLPACLSSSAHFSFSPGQVCHFLRRAKMCLMRFSEKEMIKRQRGSGNLHSTFFLLAPPVLCIPTVSSVPPSAGRDCSADSSRGGYAPQMPELTEKAPSAAPANDEIPAFLFSPFSSVPSSGPANHGSTSLSSSDSGSVSVKVANSTLASSDSRGTMASSGKISPCPSGLLPVAGAPPGFPGSFSASFPGSSTSLPSRSSKPLCCPAPPGVDKICRCKCNHRRQELQTEIRRKLKQDRKACMALINDFPDLVLVLGSKFTSGRTRGQGVSSSASSSQKKADSHSSTSTGGGGDGPDGGKNMSGECSEGSQPAAAQRPPPSVPVAHGLAFLACARTCQLEILAYLVGVDPWKYAKNRHEAPNPELIPGIVARYKAAVKTREYGQMLKNWEAEQAKERSFAFQDIKPFDVSVGSRNALFHPLGTTGRKSNQSAKSGCIAGAADSTGGGGRKTCMYSDRGARWCRCVRGKR